MRTTTPRQVFNMAMDRIQGRPPIHQGALENFRRTDRKDQGEGNEATAGAPGPGKGKAAGGDQLEISPAGQQLVDLKEAVETGKSALAALPDVREERVAEARQRLAQGSYHSSAVREKVAEKLVGVFGAMEADLG